MAIERYSEIYKNYTEGVNLKVGRKAKSFKFTKTREPDKKYRLFTVGETGLFYQWKNEPDNPAHYHTITDALDPVNTDKGAFSLNLSSKKCESYIRRAYKKIVWTPKLAYINMNPTPEIWDFGFTAKTEELTIACGGYVRMRVDVRYKKAGVSADDNALPADECHVINLPEGSCDFKEYKKTLKLPTDKIASVGIFIEGVNYSGKVFVERPFMTSPEIPDKSVLPDFSVPAGRDYFDWTGQYLSRKEWPEFRLKLNGTVFFEGEIFERCHRGSEWSVDVPESLLIGDNTLDIELISDYHDPLPYNIFELALIESPAGDFSILSVNEAAPANGKAYALIRTGKDNLTLHASYSENLSGTDSFYFEKAGLYGISFDTKAPTENASFTLTDGKTQKTASVKRIVIKENDGIITGTGDMVYVKQDEGDVEEFLSWYVSEGLGNMLTIRPVYRWSGTRVLNKELFQTLARVLNELGMTYPHMLDGRELPGICANPDEELISGKGFLGRQMHERDGAVFYWRRYKAASTPTAKQKKDLYAEAWREDAPHMNLCENGINNYIYSVNTDKKLDTTPTFDGDTVASDTCQLHRNPNLPKDMEYAYHECVERINTERFGIKRHTGPSTMFKYMLDGGYEWVGAETMYGTMEPLMSFLRGATLDRGIKSCGVHHALQWSSSPEEAPEHVRRYRLALYVSYMQGAVEINSEEGLWHLEEYYSYFNRFSEACKAHAEQQKDFYRYISTHTRRGKFYTPLGIIHGRYDGWHGFGRNSTWGWLNVKDTDAEKSWDLLDVFYPEGNLGDSLYCHGFPTDKPLGFYSSTPLGNIDAIPVEDRSSRFGDYKALAFLGYNKFTKEDGEKLLDYVKRGGKLLLTFAHLTKTTDYSKILNGELDFDADIMSLTLGKPQFKKSSFNASSLELVTNLKPGYDVVFKADDGSALAVKYKIGKGEITLFTAKAYPAHAAIKALYASELRSLSISATDSENIYAKADSGVEFAVYERDSERDIYFLAVDWYRAPEILRHAKLRIEENEFDITLPFGVMIKTSVCDKYAAFPHSENAEVISVKDGMARVQGTGRVKFTFINGKDSYKKEIDFTGLSYQEIKI